MKIIFSKKNHGVAVIVALVAVTVLTMLAGAFCYSMKVEARLASNADHDEELLWIGRAGIERARWILALEGNLPLTDKNQIWAGGPGEGLETNGPLAGLDLKNFPVGEGSVSITMTEQEGKININLADTALIQQVLTTMGANAGDLSSVSDAIQDWVDPDDATRPAGAESDFYQGQSPPYYAKNAPMDDISELLLIKGISQPMFKGGAAANNPGTSMLHHHLGFPGQGQNPEYPFGLADIFTPFSSGKINLNTADKNVLSVLPGMDTPTVEAIEKFRTEIGPDGNQNKLENFGQLTAIGISPQATAQLQRYGAFRGSTYEVHATAQIGDHSREFVAILFRNGPTVSVFDFYWK